MFKFVYLLLSLFFSTFYIVNGQVDKQYSAIILLPLDSGNSFLKIKIADIDKKHQYYGDSANKSIWVTRHDYINDPVKFAKAMYYIDLDTTKQIKQFKIDLSVMELYTVMDLTNIVANEGRNFFRRYRNKLFVLSNFSGQYRLYPVKRTETFYGEE